ncbi:hypothetical protein D3C87_2115410 [compost metagenome]
MNTRPKWVMLSKPIFSAIWDTFRPVPTSRARASLMRILFKYSVKVKPVLSRKVLQKYDGLI